MTLTIAILGRPNVGKSTLFNRLVGKRLALVQDSPGVTRDRIAADAAIGDFRFRVIDTAGLDVGGEDSLEERLRKQSLQGLAEADLGLFLIDARAGVTPLDHEIARWLLRQDTAIQLIANKGEGRIALAQAAEAWALGLGEPMLLSAEHGDGVPDLLAAMRARASELGMDEDDEDEDDEPFAPADPEGVAMDAPEDHGPLRLAIVGRPNAGKSTLINRLLQEERMLTGPEPGLTRDAVRLAWRYRDREIELIDTAGLRKKARIDETLEKMASSASVEAIAACHSCILVVDASAPLEKQDLAIANLAVRRGRSLTIAANKWDLVRDKEEARKILRERIEWKLPQIKGVALQPISALGGKNVEKLLPMALAADRRWRLRAPTAKLNRWLEQMIAANPPPMAQNRRIKLRYATQVAQRPPRIVLFANKPADALPQSYSRYLENGLRKAFDLDGVPLRLVVKHSKNPYRDG